MPDQGTLKRVAKDKRAGAPKRGSAKLKAQAARDDEQGKHPGREVSPRRSRAARLALSKEPHAAGSHLALSRHAYEVARRK